MKDNIRLFFATLLSATFAIAQPTPPSSQSVTATTSTGVLVSPSNFFTGNQAAIASAAGNAGITGNVTIGASNTLTLSGTATGTPTGGTLNFSNLTFTLPAGAFQAGSLVATAIADPATPPTNTGYVFYDSTHKNYNIKNDAGTTLNMVIPKTAVTNEFVTAVARNGTISTAQPSISNISGLGSGWSTTLTAATGTTGQVLASNGTSYVATTISGTSIFGTANQITASAATGNVTLTLPSSVIFPGTATLNGTNTLTLGGGGTGGATISASGNTTASNLVITPPSAGKVFVTNSSSAAYIPTLSLKNASTGETGLNVYDNADTLRTSLSWNPSIGKAYIYTANGGTLDFSDGGAVIGMQIVNGTGVKIPGTKYLKFGDLTNGPTIAASGTSPNEILELRPGVGSGAATATGYTAIYGSSNSGAAPDIARFYNTEAGLKASVKYDGTLSSTTGLTGPRVDATNFYDLGSGISFNSSTSVFVKKNGGGSTGAQIGLNLANTTASNASPAPVQYSPALLFTGHAWNTTTLVDNYLEAMNELRPATAATPTSTLAWAFRRSTAGTGAFTDAMTLTSGGYLNVTNGYFLANGAGAIEQAGNSMIFTAGGAGGTLGFKTAGSVTALTLDASQNATFTGYVGLNNTKLDYGYSAPGYWYSQIGAGNNFLGTNWGIRHAADSSNEANRTFTFYDSRNSNPVAAIAILDGTITTKGLLVSQGGLKRVSTQFDKTSNTTLGDVTGLSVALAASTSYRFRAVLFTTSNVAGGVKAAIAHSGTVTNIIYEGFSTAAGVTTQSRSTTSGTAVGAVTAVTAATITIEGTITTNTAGNLTAQFAQNASNGTASSVLVGSYLEVFGF